LGAGTVTNGLHERLSYVYDAAVNLAYRTNNALVQTLAMNNLNQITNSSEAPPQTVEALQRITFSSFLILRFLRLAFRFLEGEKDGNRERFKNLTQMQRISGFKESSRSGTYTVSGGVEGAITNVTVNTLAAALYTDKSYAKDGFSLADGHNPGGPHRGQVR
jgi:hypothetical protein